MARATPVRPRRGPQFHVGQTWVTAASQAPRLVVVCTDPGRGAALTRVLEAVGYEIRLCGGPSPSRPCPMAVEGRCSLVAGADAVVLCGAAASDTDPGLVGLLAQHYPDVPVIVTAAHRTFHGRSHPRPPEVEAVAAVSRVEGFTEAESACLAELVHQLAEALPVPSGATAPDGPDAPNRARSHLALLALAHDVQDAAVRGDRGAVLRGLRELRVDLERHTELEAAAHAFAHCSVPVRDTIAAGQRRLAERLGELQGLVELPDSEVSRTTARLVRAWRELLRRQARLETIASLGGPGRPS